MIIDEAIGLSAVIINETVGDKINKANAVINYLNDLNAPCLRLKRYTTSIVNNSYKKNNPKKRRKLSKKYVIFGAFIMQFSQSCLRVTVV